MMNFWDGSLVVLKDWKLNALSRSASRSKRLLQPCNWRPYTANPDLGSTTADSLQRANQETGKIATKKFKVTIHSCNGRIDSPTDENPDLTLVQAVVTQSKRHPRNLRIEQLDGLRGTTYRCYALRCTTKAALKQPTTSVALRFVGICKKTIDATNTHDADIRRPPHEVLAVDANAFAELEGDA